MKNRQNGFTLLEILIALFIFTLVALIMTKSLHTILATQDATEQNAEQLSKMQMALLFISRDLEQTLDRPILDQEGRPEESFVGSRTTLNFTHGGFANPEGQLQSSTLQRTGYRFEKDELIRDTWDALDQGPHSQPHSRVLLNGVKELSFRFLDSKNEFHALWPKDNQEPSASSANHNNSPEKIAAHMANQLPRAVELTLILARGGRLQQTFILPQLQVPHE